MLTTPNVLPLQGLIQRGGALGFPTPSKSSPQSFDYYDVIHVVAKQGLMAGRFVKITLHMTVRLAEFFNT